ncbi:MAG: hypothetical protein WA705_29595 [Candidatus Ozemobacteraceae bacterium]
MKDKSVSLSITGLPHADLATFENTDTRWLVQLLVLITCGAVTALAKKASFSLGIPGHSALLWLSVMIVGRAMIRRDGAGLLIGMTTALWGVPFGLENTLGHNLALYGATGITIDLVSCLPGIEIRRFWSSLTIGITAHMVKFGFIVAGAFSSHVTQHFLLVGLAKSAFLHLLFGAGAGILGFIAFKTIQTFTPTFPGKNPHSV